MPSFRASELLPPGFCAVGALSEGDCTVIMIRAMGANSFVHHVARFRTGSTVDILAVWRTCRSQGVEPC